MNRYEAIDNFMTETHILERLFNPQELSEDRLRAREVALMQAAYAAAMQDARKTVKKYFSDVTPPVQKNPSPKTERVVSEDTRAKRKEYHRRYYLEVTKKKRQQLQKKRGE